MRPVLKPALRRLWRDTDTLQLGIDPRHAVVLTGLTDVAGGVLRLLDGTRDWDGVVRAAVKQGVDRGDTERLLALLRDSGALDDASATVGAVAGAERVRLGPDLAHLSLVDPSPGAALGIVTRRARATVTVAGCGRVGSLVASLLAASGVGRLLLRDDRTGGLADSMPGGAEPGTAAQPRAVRAAAAVNATSTAHVDAAVRLPDSDDCADSDLVVVVTEPYRSPPPELVELFAAEGVPYLVAGIRETAGVVGPLVRPGASSCPRCHDLARTDRDPAWPVIAAQLATARDDRADPCDVVLAAAVASLAAGQALAHVAGPSPVLCVDATLELRVPEWTLRRRLWRPHPGCGCVRGAASGAGSA